MKATERGNNKHRQLRTEDYLQMVSAEQKEYAEVCASPKMTETDITNTKCKPWKRRIPNGTYGAVGGRPLNY